MRIRLSRGKISRSEPTYWDWEIQSYWDLEIQS